MTHKISSEEAFINRLLVDPPPSRGEVSYKSVSKRNLLAHHDAHPFVLDLLLLKSFGTDYYAWDAKTIWSELQSMFSTTVSDMNKNKIEAMRTLHITDSPWRSWQVFEKVVQALNNNIPQFDITQRCSLPQLWNAVGIMGTTRNEPFQEEVPPYVAAVLLDEDVAYCPDTLRFASPLIRENKAVRTALAEYSGGLLEENPVDIQLARILTARNYAEMRDAQMKQQMVLLKDDKQL